MRTRLILPVALLAALTPVAGQETTFESVLSGPPATASAESFGVAWADMDGDGDLDLFFANGIGAVANDLFRNLGDGTFEAVINDPVVTTTGNSTRGLWGDVDGDGDMDLFVTNRSGGDNDLFLNNGGVQAGTEGEFSEVLAGSAVTDGGNSQQALMVDLTGDGDLDIFVANGSGEDNFYYLNQGGIEGGSQGSYTKVAFGAAVTDGGNSTSAISADFDGNGAPDIYVTNANGEDNFLYTNPGNGNLAAVTTGDAVNDAADSQEAAAGDIDGDGDVDMLVANFLEVNDVFQNQGGAQAGTEGDFNAINAGSFTAGSAASLGVTLHDWDLDGDLDAAVFNCCGQDNQLYRNNGFGSFIQRTTGPVVTGGGYSSRGAFADYDQDGDMDLAVANRSNSGSNTNFLYRNLSPGTFGRVTSVDIVTDTHLTFDVTFGDVDGDGDEDVFVANKLGDDNDLYINQGGAQAGTEGDYVRQTTGIVVNDAGNSFAGSFGDMDGDGDLDLAVANRNDEDNFLYVNQGGAQAGVEGDFVKETTGPVVNDGGSSRDVRWGDTDGDGDNDLFIANSTDSSNFFYINQGGIQGGSAGVFVKETSDPVATDSGKSYGGDFGDMDGDGDLDLFVASRAGENNFLYVNQGGIQAGAEGEFVCVGAGPLVTDGGDSYAGVWGDMDNDGDLDLVVANVEENFLYRNQGGAQTGTEGTFVAIVGDPVVTDDESSRRPEWADFDMDGDMDLFVPNTTGDNGLYRSLGNGSFLKMDSAFPDAEGGNSRAGAWADADGDGDPDLLVANHSEAMSLYINVGPSFVPAFADLGNALAGVDDDPIMFAHGSLNANTEVLFQVSEGAPNALTTFILGVSAIFAPFKGGVLVPSPDLLVPGIPTNSNGFWSFQILWPSGIPSASNLFFQVWIPDASGPAGFSATNGLQATTP